MTTSQPSTAFQPLRPRPEGPEGTPFGGGPEARPAPTRVPDAPGPDADRSGPRPVPSPGPRPGPDGPRLPFGPVEAAGPQDEPRTTPFERTRGPGARRSGPTLSVVPAAPGHEPPSGPRQAPVTRPTPVVRAEESLPAPAEPRPAARGQETEEADPPVLASMRDPLSGPLREPLLDAQLDRAQTGPVPIVGLTPPPGAVDGGVADAGAPDEDTVSSAAADSADSAVEDLPDAPASAPVTGRRRRAEEPQHREPAAEWTRDWASGAWAMPTAGRRRASDLPADGRATVRDDSRRTTPLGPDSPAAAEADTTEPTGPAREGPAEVDLPRSSGDTALPGSSDGADPLASPGPDDAAGHTPGDPTTSDDSAGSGTAGSADRLRRPTGPDAVRSERGADPVGGAADTSAWKGGEDTQAGPLTSGNRRPDSPGRPSAPGRGATESLFGTSAESVAPRTGARSDLADPDGRERRQAESLGSTSRAGGRPRDECGGAGTSFGDPTRSSSGGRRRADRRSSSADSPDRPDLPGRTTDGRDARSTDTPDYSDLFGRPSDATGSRADGSADPLGGPNRHRDLFGRANGTAEVRRRRAGSPDLHVSEPTDGATDTAPDDAASASADAAGPASFDLSSDSARTSEVPASGDRPTDVPTAESDAGRGESLHGIPLRIDPLDPLGAGSSSLGGGTRSKAARPAAGRGPAGRSDAGSEIGDRRDHAEHVGDIPGSSAGSDSPDPPSRGDAPSSSQDEGTAGSFPGEGTDPRLEGGAFGSPSSGAPGSLLGGSAPGARRGADPSISAETAISEAPVDSAAATDDAPTGRRAAKDGMPTIRPVPGGRRRARHRPDDAEPDPWGFATDAGPAATDAGPAAAAPEPTPRPDEGPQDRSDGLPPPRPVPRTIPRIRRASEQPVSGLFGPGEVPPSRPDDPFGTGPGPAHDRAHDEPLEDGTAGSNEPGEQQDAGGPPSEAYSSLSSREQDLLRLLQQELAVRESSPERRNGSGPYGPPDLAG